jgi:hypothetical protein
MPQQQENGDNWKRNFNVTHSIFLMHQRALTVPMRNQYGGQALGTPCALALVMMLLWWMATHDDFMLLWIGFWLLCFIKRRAEAVRLAKNGARIHSHYDGWPFDAIRFARSERAAKMMVEPILVGILGGFLFWVYQENGWRPTGLPYFVLSGVVTLPFVEMVKQTAWDKRLQGMHDARLEQEMAVQDYRDQYGDP